MKGFLPHFLYIFIDEGSFESQNWQKWSKLDARPFAIMYSNWEGFVNIKNLINNNRTLCKALLLVHFAVCTGKFHLTNRLHPIMLLHISFTIDIDTCLDRCIDNMHIIYIFHTLLHIFFLLMQWTDMFYYYFFSIFAFAYVCIFVSCCCHRRIWPQRRIWAFIHKHIWEINFSSFNNSAQFFLHMWSRTRSGGGIHKLHIYFCSLLSKGFCFLPIIIVGMLQL